MPLVVPRNQKTYTYKGKTHVNPAYRPPPAPRKVFLGAFTVDEVIGSIAGGADAEIMIASRAGGKVALKVATLSEVRNSLNTAVRSGKVAPEDAERVIVAKAEAEQKALIDTIPDPNMSRNEQINQKLKTEQQFRDNAKFWRERYNKAKAEDPNNMQAGEEDMKRYFQSTEQADKAGQTAEDMKGLEFLARDADVREKYTKAGMDRFDFKDPSKRAYDYQQETGKTVTYETRDDYYKWLNNKADNDIKAFATEKPYVNPDIERQAEAMKAQMDADTAEAKASMGKTTEEQMKSIDEAGQEAIETAEKGRSAEPDENTPLLHEQNENVKTETPKSNIPEDATLRGASIKQIAGSVETAKQLTEQDDHKETEGGTITFSGLKDTGGVGGATLSPDSPRRQIRPENEEIGLIDNVESMDLTEDIEVNPTFDYGGDPQDIDTLKDLQEEFKDVEKIDYDEEKQKAFEQGFTEHQYETFKQFRKDNKAEGLSFSDYVKYHHQFEKVNHILKRSNIDFIHFYKMKTAPQEIQQKLKDNQKKAKRLGYSGVKIDPYEDQQINHPKLNIQQVHDRIQEAEQKPDKKPDDEMSVEDLTSLYFQESQDEKEVEYEHIETKLKTDKQEIKYACELVNEAYTETPKIGHRIYYSKITGSPIARIIEEEDFITLAIRGSKDTLNFYQDLNISKTFTSEYFSEIKEEYDTQTTRGFLDFTREVYEAVYVDLLNILFQNPDKSFRITSHSLGCASALILHTIFLSTGQDVDMNIMFGSPRVFYFTNQMFDMFKQENILRICTEQDPITFMPPLDILNMFHVGKSLILSGNDYKIYPYGDFDRDIDYINELYKVGKNKLTGLMFSTFLKTFIPLGLLSPIFDVAQLENNFEFFKEMYDNHMLAKYLSDIEFLPEQLTFDIPPEEGEKIYKKQVMKNKKNLRTMQFYKKFDEYKNKKQPHAGEIKRNFVSPEVLGFYLYQKEEDIQNKVFVF
jgi:hypothetical protein